MSSSAVNPERSAPYSSFQDVKKVEELRTEIAQKKKNIENGTSSTTFCCFGSSDKSKLAKLEKALEIELGKPLPETKEQEQAVENAHHHAGANHAGEAAIAPHGAIDPGLAAGAAPFPQGLAPAKLATA
ncbi:unnamed protein product [Mucor hiemalis]